jgi:hypothetical protein
MSKVKQRKKYTDTKEKKLSTKDTNWKGESDTPSNTKFEIF